MSHGTYDSFLSQSDWITECPDTWLNIISVRVVEGVPGRD